MFVSTSQDGPHRALTYGYRRVHVLLEREGWGTNIKRTYRIYRDLGL
ncbi:hypothetical protein GGI55_006931, partial [Rhizobium leguminosarum]|nr:hypothetical protein [Rhizobium leguminosarum]MBB4436761.1 hypothetical protein [Rhizobium esperanzae]MBB4483586.1 hypothetical protein [Rhizobium etli]MBB4421457.1 hypothetical protein [Rhizobium leguminosarum]MBB4546308.1 hypothetical protein [Rhizobium leguminosarum]